MRGTHVYSDVSVRIFLFYVVWTEVPNDRLTSADLMIIVPINKHFTKVFR